MSLGVIGDAMKILYEDSKHDEELRDWFQGVDSYIRKVRFSLCPQTNTETDRPSIGIA